MRRSSWLTNRKMTMTSTRARLAIVRPTTIHTRALRPDHPKEAELRAHHYLCADLIASGRRNPLLRLFEIYESGAADNRTAGVSSAGDATEGHLTQSPMKESDPQTPPTKEHARLKENVGLVPPWRHWGPYVAERAWGTVREDYSADGNAWEYFSHDVARSRAYRWGEDGLAGICDRYQMIVFALAFWNGRDPILKERAFGLVPSKAITARTSKNITSISTTLRRTAT